MDHFKRFRNGLSSKDWHEAKRSGLVSEILAEVEMIKRGEIPPGWSGWVDCARCGPMPETVDHAGERVEWCPWCHEWAEVLERARAEHRALVERQALHSEVSTSRDEGAGHGNV